MALEGLTEGYVTYTQQFRWNKIYIVPNMTQNGTWLSEGYSCRGNGLDGLSNLYQVFNGTYSSYLNKFNENAWIEVCLPEAIEIEGCDMTSSDGFFPATGEVYYSDDGTTYTKCGSWTDTSNSKNATANVDKGSGAHRIWKFVSTARASAHLSSNADVSTAKLFYVEKEMLSVDNSLPEGAGGIANAYATYVAHKGLDLRNLDVYFTYKQDDKVNLWEGSDAAISGIASAGVAYRPHDGLDIRGIDGSINYRPHDGFDIRKLDLYFLYKQEDKVDSFKIPFGIGGNVSVYILERLHSLVGFLNDYGIEKIAGIVLGNDYYPLKSIQSFNDIPFFNNTTEDDKTTEEGG